MRTGKDEVPEHSYENCLALKIEFNTGLSFKYMGYAMLLISEFLWFGLRDLPAHIHNDHILPDTKQCY